MYYEIIPPLNNESSTHQHKLSHHTHTHTQGHIIHTVTNSSVSFFTTLWSVFPPTIFKEKRKASKDSKRLTPAQRSSDWPATDTAKVNRLWIYQNEKNKIFTGNSCLPSAQQRSKWLRHRCADSVQNAVCT